MLNNVSVMQDKVPIHLFSTMNEWMDCVFIVNKGDEARAIDILDCALAEWFDADTSEAYGDWLCQALEYREIEYEVFFKK